LLVKKCLIIYKNDFILKQLCIFNKKQVLFRWKMTFILDLLFIDIGKVEDYNSKKDVFSLKKIFFAKKEVL